MGVTFYPAGNKAEAYELFRYGGLSTAHALFNRVRSNFEGRRSTPHKNPRLFSSSFPMKGPADHSVIGVKNGLVDTVMQAYNTHQMLVIRPDDVWITILTQFNYFVNANAESLRESFVAHKGEKELTVQVPSIDHINVEMVTDKFTDLLHENITDSSVREWIIPNFTTTTPSDKAVGGIVMMSTFQKYFNYTVTTRCGIPAVTLEGVKSDWESILRRIEKLKEYGLQTTAWYHLLRPILKRFVAAFDDPSNPDNLDFWNKVAHRIGRMSGISYLSGWLTAFCVFSREGKWTGPALKLNVDPESDYTMLTAAEFAAMYLVPETTTSNRVPQSLVLDDFRYQTITMGKIPPGFVGVDVRLVDDRKEYNAAFIAGCSAYSVSSSNDKDHSNTGENDTLKPSSGWWLYEKSV